MGREETAGLKLVPWKQMAQRRKSTLEICALGELTSAMLQEGKGITKQQE
jgi:hypothetical protein